MLYRMCGRQVLLPRSLQIPICYDPSDAPLYRGGAADVWKGQYLGRHVAAKVLRVYSTSGIDRIRMVSLQGPAKVVLMADADRCRGSSGKLWHGTLSVTQMCFLLWVL